MDKYCEISDVENYLLTEIDSSFETQVELWIKGVTSLMDTMANRKLVAPAIGSGEDFESRYYDGNDKEFITIDDCQEIDKLKIGDEYGDSLTEITAYITYPRIAPYRKVILRNDIFTKGIQNIAVEGRFGFFNDIPADIRTACAVIVAGIINSSNKGNDTKASESIGNYSVSYKDAQGLADYNNAVSTVERYKKIDF